MNLFTIADSGTWTLETLIRLPIAAVLTIGLSVLAVLAWRWAQGEKGKPYGDYGLGLVFAVALGAFALLTASLTAVGMYPYKAEYHQWRETSGTVTKIDKRLIGDGGGGMSDKFVVRFDDSGQQFGCDDTRCASVEVGDQLTLSCKRAWQYTGTDGYDCRFVSTEVAS